MAWKHLGETFDIHGGGIDLLFPHHENEIAQSRCVFHAPVMANYWLHNGFLQVEGAKMSKSEGNFVTIRELLGEWPGEVLRLNMLRTHYRQPIDWTASGLEESQKTLNGWYEIIGDMAMEPGIQHDSTLLTALCDDLNTPSTIARLHAIAGEIRESASGLRQIELKQTLKASGALLGLLSKTRRNYLESDPLRSVVDEAKVDGLIEARARARAVKNFALSDQIRDELSRMGAEIEDRKDGTTTWKLKKKVSS
jgi:cysteinyl-tRNA synthetase